MFKSVRVLTWLGYCVNIGYCVNVRYCVGLLGCVMCEYHMAH